MGVGTSFRCGGNFGPTRHCPPKTLQVLIGDKEDDIKGEIETAEVNTTIEDDATLQNV